MVLELMSVEASSYNIIAVFVVLYVFYQRVVYPRFMSPFRCLPQPKTGILPFAGVFRLFREPTTNSYLQYAKETANDGIIRVRGLLGSEELLLTNGNAAAEVLVKSPFDYERGGLLRHILGGSDGLLFFGDESHKQERRLGLQHLGVRRVKSLYSMFWQKSVKVAKLIALQDIPSSAMESEALISDADLDYWFSRFALDNVMISVLGADFNILEDPKNEMASLFEKFTAPGARMRIFFALMATFPRWMVASLPFKVIQTPLKAVQRLGQMCRKFVDEKQDEIQDMDEKSKPGDLLGSLAQWGKFSSAELAVQVFMYLLVGHATVSATATWTIYLLAQHPEIQQRLRSEVGSHIGPNDPKDLAEKDLAGLMESVPFLDAICNEALRLYPAVHMIRRISSKCNKIMGTEVPKGTPVIMAPWVINRSPHLWGADSEEFQPQRWINERTGTFNQRGGAVQDYCMLSFSQGIKGCVGQEYARMELKALVAAFVYSFDVELVKPVDSIFPTEIPPSRPLRGMKFRLVKIS